MKGRPLLSIIMPVYNTPNIRKNIQETLKDLKKMGYLFEFVVVDDGSTQDCFTQAKKIKDPHLTVVGYIKNEGKGNALKYGFTYTRGEYVVFIDSGNDLTIQQIPSFLKILEKEKAAIVIGSKRHKDSKVHYPFTRRFMSGTYQLLNRLLFNLDVKDTQVGIKLFKRETLEKILPHISIKRFAFDLEVLVLAKKYGYKVIEAPIILTYRFSSTINSKAVVEMIRDTGYIFYKRYIQRAYD